MVKITITIDGDNITVNQSDTPTKVENTTKRYFIVIGHSDDINSWIELITEDYIEAINVVLDQRKYWKEQGITFSLLMQENGQIMPCNGTDFDIDR